VLADGETMCPYGTVVKGSSILEKFLNHADIANGKGEGRPFILLLDGYSSSDKVVHGEIQSDHPSSIESQLL